MAADIWKICSETKARDYYNEVEYDKGSRWCSIDGDVAAASALTGRCHKLLNAFKEAAKDQISYELDIEDINDEINLIQNEIMEKVQKLELEIMVLRRKEDNGTITDEEREELAAKTAEVSSLMGEYDSKSEDANQEIQNKVQHCQSSFSDLDPKISIAKAYGNDSQDLAKELNDKKLELKFWYDTDEWKKKWEKARNVAVDKLLNKSGKLLNEVTNVENTEKKFNNKYSYIKVN